MPPTPSLIALRFGVGLPVAADAADTPAAMVRALAGADQMAALWPVVGFATIDPLVRTLRQNSEAAKKDPDVLARMLPLRQKLDGLGATALRHSIARVLDAGDGFRERLVAFWADHFTVTVGGREDEILPYAFVEDAIRPHVGATFGQMLTAATMHPAMLIYLDQTRSIGPNSRQAKRRGAGGLNENLARELLELHTLGVDAGYGQADVRQMAELLTGLSYDPRRGFAFLPTRAEPGPETVLGKVYDGQGDAPIRAALADLARHPDTARHLARKLAVHFLSDAPDPAVVDALADTWTRTGGDLMAVYAALLDDAASWAEAGEKARQPWDFILAALRALGVTGAEVAGWSPDMLETVVLGPLRAMGQKWKGPRGPDGWPEEAAAWITPQGLAERIHWAMTQPSGLVTPLPQPVDLARSALGSRASAAVLWAAERAENRAEGVGIVLASPEFNRR